jgi:O-succinylbenzoic acid--CoA ligase
MSSATEQAWIVERARLSPDAPALTFEGRTSTWSALAAESEGIALRLAALGVARGDRIATIMASHPRLVVLLHAAQRLGAVLVPINTRLAGAETARILDHAHPRLTLTDGRTGIAGRDCLDAFEELDAVGVARASTLPSAIDAQAALMIVHTSGSTGTPKGVVLTNANHRAAAAASRSRLRHGPEDVWLATLPLYHVGGLAILTRSVLEGSEVVLEDGFDLHRLATHIMQGSASMISLVPTMLARLLEMPPPAVSPRVRCLLVGGAALPPALAQRAAAAGLPIAATYGMTEACSQIATTLPLSDDTTGGTVGRPLDCTEVRIDDPGADGIGEICVRGANVCAGYFRNAEADARMLAGGWLRTGDLGSLDERGRLRVEGRRDDLIVTGGENVSPAEVESVLQAHPDVRECAVFGVDDEEWGHRVVALVVGAEPARVRPDSLRTWCRMHLAGYKTPAEVRQIDELPRVGAGKVDRSALPRAWRETATA